MITSPKMIDGISSGRETFVEVSRLAGAEASKEITCEHQHASTVRYENVQQQGSSKHEANGSMRHCPSSKLCMQFSSCRMEQAVRGFQAKSQTDYGTGQKRELSIEFFLPTRATLIQNWSRNAFCSISTLNSHQDHAQKTAPLRTSGASRHCDRGAKCVASRALKHCA